MKKNSMKKILSSLCILAMTAAPLSVFADHMASSENQNISASVYMYNLAKEQLGYFINNNDVDNYYDYYVVSDKFTDNQIMLDDKIGFLINYKICGKELENEPTFFNMVVGCRDENNNIVDRKELRSQYFMYGDVNCDGIIDYLDVLALQRFIYSDRNVRENDAIYYDESIRTMLDYNCNDVVDSEDTALLEAYLEGAYPGDDGFIIGRPAFGEMGWVTIYSEDVNILGIGNNGERYMVIGTDTTGITDGVFYLYDDPYIPGL